MIAVIDVFVSKEAFEEYLELKRLHSETEAVQQECKKIAEYAEDKEWKDNPVLVSEILQVLLQYETALSYASIMLDTDIYNELNLTIAQEWEGIKKRYYD